MTNDNLSFSLIMLCLCGDNTLIWPLELPWKDHVVLDTRRVMHKVNNELLRYIALPTLVYVFFFFFLRNDTCRCISTSV